MIHKKKNSMGGKAESVVYLLIAGTFILLNTVPVQTIFHEYGKRWLLILITSFTLSYLLTPIMMLLAKKTGSVDVPNQRKIHKESTPLLGGAAIYLSFMVAILSNNIYSGGAIPILIASFLMLSVGLWDDVKEVSAKIRLAVQLISCMIVIFSGITLKLFPDNIFGYLPNVFITIFWIIGITNALNFFDGMDGLASGISCIIALFLGVIAFQSGQTTLGWLSIAIVGSSLGFLPFNFKKDKPASIFLGDAGSTFLGFTLACLAVQGQWSDKPLVSFTAPLLIFWVLIFDMVYITIFRVYTGKVKTVREWIEYVGKDHLHHRLEALFKSKRWSVIVIYLITICLGLTAILLRNADNTDAMFLLLQATIIVIIISILEIRGQQQDRRKT